MIILLLFDANDCSRGVEVRFSSEDSFRVSQMHVILRLLVTNMMSSLTLSIFSHYTALLT